MIVDKNGVEINIGDTVHYKRPEKIREVDMGNGRTRTMTSRAKDVVFTIEELRESPFSKHGGYDPRLEENRMWLAGSEFEGGKNSVSPLAVVKVDTMVKKKVTSLSFTEVDKKPKDTVDVREAFTSDKPSVYKSFLNIFR